MAANRSIDIYNALTPVLVFTALLVVLLLVLLLMHNANDKGKRAEAICIEGFGTH